MGDLAVLTVVDTQQITNYRLSCPSVGLKQLHVKCSLICSTLNCDVHVAVPKCYQYHHGKKDAEIRCADIGLHQIY